MFRAGGSGGWGWGNARGRGRVFVGSGGGRGGNGGRLFGGTEEGAIEGWMDQAVCIGRMLVEEHAPCRGRSWSYVPD